MGYYFDDPSKLGSWYVPDGQSPAEAIQKIKDDTGITLSPILQYSVDNNPVTQQVNGGNPSPTTKDSPPKPTSYETHGAVLVPKRPELTTYQKSNVLKPRFVSGSPGTADVNIPECDPGYYYDEFNEACVPIDTGPVGVGGGPPGVTTVQTPASINVIVNNAVNLASGVGQAIADTIGQGIQDAVDQAKQSAATAAQAVTDSIQKSVDQVADSSKSLVQELKDSLGYVAGLVQRSISGIVDYLREHIGDLIGTVKDTINNVIVPLAKTVDNVINKINDVLTNTIAPIFNTIASVTRQTQALIEAIKGDIANGIQGLLQLPQDISNSIGSIEATISRTIDQIGLKKQDGTSVFLDTTGKDSVWDRLQTIGHGVNILGGIQNEGITFDKVVKLTEPDLGEAGAAAVTALGNEIASLVNFILAGNRSTFDKFKTGLPLVIPLLGGEISPFVGVWELIRAIGELFEPFYDFAKEDLRAKAGLSKLPVSTVLEAWRRKLVDDSDLAEDLAVNGWNSGRIAVLKDLQQHLFQINTAIDMHHRGILNDTDFTLIMSRNGVTGEQQQAYLEQHLKLFDVNLAATANRWGLIDEQALDAVLKENRYTETEITTFKATMLQRETVADVISRERLTVLFAGLGYVPEGFATPSSDTLQAATRDGVDARKALDDWQASYHIPALQEWIIGYFRNLFTRQQLIAAFDYYRVPSQWRDIIVNTHRPLIPFRTIPSMLASGIIDEPYAKQQLQEHGFDLVATEALLKYATTKQGKQKVAASGDVFGLSIATARGYFDAGTITADEYTQVLLAHGYDKQSANFTVKTETAHAQMLERRQVATDIIAEVKAGILTLSQAENMMDASHFSQAEKAKTLNAISRTRRQANRVPSEAELHEMAVKGAITIDNYKSGMIANGWTDPWLTAFITWRFPSASVIVATP